MFSKGDDPMLWMLYSVMGGGVMLGAIFMATDYVTSPAMLKAMRMTPRLADAACPTSAAVSYLLYTALKS